MGGSAPSPAIPQLGSDAGGLTVDRYSADPHGKPEMTQSDHQAERGFRQMDFLVGTVDAASDSTFLNDG